MRGYIRPNYLGVHNHIGPEAHQERYVESSSYHRHASPTAANVPAADGNPVRCASKCRWSANLCARTKSPGILGFNEGGFGPRASGSRFFSEIRAPRLYPGRWGFGLRMSFWVVLWVGSPFGSPIQYGSLIERSLEGTLIQRIAHLQRFRFG